MFTQGQRDLIERFKVAGFDVLIDTSFVIEERSDNFWLELSDGTGTIKYTAEVLDDMLVNMQQFDDVHQGWDDIDPDTFWSNV